MTPVHVAIMNVSTVTVPVPHMYVHINELNVSQSVVCIIIIYSAVQIIHMYHCSVDDLVMTYTTIAHIQSRLALLNFVNFRTLTISAKLCVKFSSLFRWLCSYACVCVCVCACVNTYFSIINSPPMCFIILL